MAITTRTRKRPQRASARLKAASFGADLLTFAVAVAASFFVRFGGELYVSEIILVLLLPVFILLRPRSIFRPGLNVVLVLLALWLFGQVMTDLYRSSEMIDRIREYANIGFFAIDLAGLAVLLGKNERRKAIFVAGFAVGSLLAVRFQPSDYTSDYPWKFGYAMGTNLGVALVSCYFFRYRRYMIAGLLLAGIMGMNLVLNFRSPVLIFLITIALVLPVIPERIGKLTLLPPAGSAMRVAVLAAMALVGGGAAVGLVHWVTSSGAAGQAAQTKNEAQSQSNLGTLLGGRPEILVSSRAVWDSPILGHGAGGRDYKYIEMLNDIEAENGMTMDLRDAEEAFQGAIPTHSHLMGAWVKAGIFGGVFWIYILWLTLKTVVRVAMQRPSLAPVYMYLLVGFFWDILFSPFGAWQRMTAALAIVIIIDQLQPAPGAFGTPSRPRTVRWAGISPGGRLTPPRRGNWRMLAQSREVDFRGSYRDRRSVVIGA